MSFPFSSFIESILDREYVAVAVATAGGIIVFVGLLTEKIADWMDERFLGGSYRPHKRMELFGWCILMFGIAIEVATAAGLTVREYITEAKNNPLNQPIADISAIATIKVEGTDFSEYPLWGSPAVAWMNLYDNRTNDEHGGRTWSNEPFFTSTAISSLSSMNAYDIDRVRYMGATPRSGGIEYILRFHPDELLYDFKSENPVTFPPKANDVIQYVRVLIIDVKFIPHDAEVTGGSVYLLINGSLHKDFKILPQKAMNSRMMHTLGDIKTSPGESGFSLIATNDAN